MSTREKAVFLTGAAGYIGSRVLAALAARGDRVIATDVARPRTDLPDGVAFYTADVRDLVRHAPAVARCGSIVHCGGISGPMLLADNPAELIDINMRGTTQLLSLAAAHGMRRVVTLSSVSAYGDTPEGMETVDESAPLRASTVYGTSKAASDLVVETYHRLFKLSAVALRIGWVYGPGRVTDAIIQPIVRSAQGEAYAMASGASHRLQFVHIDDVVAAVLAAHDAPSLGQAAYNINGRDTVRVGRIFDLVAGQVPGVTATVGPGPMEGVETHGVMSIAAAARDLGWTPAIAFEEGLRTYVDWLRHNRY
ncbi:NAD-dependent epimerase/dehydratase family protein [Ensifer soli]|uniref:NAD-dependent epimerase/dehydratase family protein n=1 Tax=Ciceribacter sp. sgz301302 TaxID=3342379 RepID=UPI0035B7DFF5